MDIEINEVQEIIKNLDSGGEISIKEEKYLKVAKLCVKLAAENVALKTFCKNAAFDADYEAELGMERGGFTDALNNIETPATDRIVAGIKADGVKEFIGRMQQHVDEGDFVGDEAAVIVGAIDCGKEFCEQLREGQIMTDITELAQSLKAAAIDAKELAIIARYSKGRAAAEKFYALANPNNVIALVEALEKAQQRIDELDSRTVKLPKLKMLEDYLAEVAIEERKQILVGVKLEFHRACVAAGIKVEAE